MPKKKSAAKKQQTSAAKINTPGTSTPSPVPTTAVPNGNVESTSGFGSPYPPQTPPPTELPSPIQVLEHEKVRESEEARRRAENIKEQGNIAFKAAKYTEAIDLYSKAIEVNSSEPSYFTNRAAAYIALKRFRPALEDCQVAASLQSASPSPKTLLRLARCQLAIGSSTAALSTIGSILTIDPKNPPAIQMKDKVQQLLNHVKNFEQARKKKDWGLARLALDQCLQAVEGDGSEVPPEWRYWRVELELSRANWEAANAAANDALRLNSNSPDALTLRGLVLFLGGRLPQALQHVMSALRFDPGHEPAQKLRKRIKDIERVKEEGNVAFKAGKLQEALEKYTECLKRIGESQEEGNGGQIRAMLLSNRAATFLKLEQHKEALSDTETSLLLWPNSFKALRTRARINLHLEKYDASIADFHAAIQQAETEGSATDADVRALKVELKKAEAVLKRSKSKDYYKILGVGKDCNEADVKKAYRRESLKHHPDKGGDEEKFKLVVEANAVLSDPQRRARYDMGEDEDGLNGGGGTGGNPFSGRMNPGDLEELFSAFGGGQFNGRPFAFGGGPPPRGGFGESGRRGHAHGFGF